MKTTSLILLAILALLATSCAVRGHAGRHSTGASITTSSGGGVGGSVHY